MVDYEKIRTYAFRISTGDASPWLRYPFARREGLRSGNLFLHRSEGPVIQYEKGIWCGSGDRARMPGPRGRVHVVPAPDGLRDGQER